MNLMLMLKKMGSEKKQTPRLRAERGLRRTVEKVIFTAMPSVRQQKRPNDSKG